MNNNQLDTRKTHRSNIIKSLEHRIEVAKNSGNMSLVKQLEAEKRYYA